MPVAYQQYNLCICIEPHVSCSGFHLKYTSNWMLRFCKDILQYYHYSIHSKTNYLSGSFFLQKAFLNCNGCFFPFRWMCWRNYHGYKDDVYLLQCYTKTAIHFMNHEKLYQIIKTSFNICICLNHCCWCQHRKLYKVWWKSKISTSVSHLDHSFYK